MLASIVQLFLVSFGLMYFVALAFAGMRVLAQSRPPSTRHAASRRAARQGAPRRFWRQFTVADQQIPRAGVVVDDQDWQTYYLVPCLNEELVIGSTVRQLLFDKRARVVVIDDGSDDRTAELAMATDPARVIVVRRELPNARQGKGPALNAGFARVLEDASVRHLQASKIILCVMDADGRLSAGAPDAVLPLFADPEVGGVQLAVRIRNRRDGLLPRLQDALFLGLSAAFQLARVRCGTVSLGGNGQFTRLTALLELDRDPWRRSLTEDLDLSIALSVAGWRITTTADAYVSQQGVTTIRALYKQWTRWYQGHMESARWVPKLWRSRRLSHVGMLEITLFLMVPWVLVLPWSILFHYTLIAMIGRFVDWFSTGSVGNDALQRGTSLVLWYFVSFAPNWLVGYLYYRQDRRVGLVRAIAIGHALLLANYIAYAAAWRALYRMLCGLHGWSKTARNRETDTQLEPASSTAGAALVPAVAATRPIVIPAPRKPAELTTVGVSRSGAARPGAEEANADAWLAALVGAWTEPSRRAAPGARPPARPAGSHRAKSAFALPSASRGTPARRS
jgi:1,2-diacylglycerol 3-beta-glucosyltransferase